MIEIIDPQTVLVDGANYGAVVDTALNCRELASDIQIALNAWWQSKQVDFSARLTAEAQITALTSELESLRNPPKPAEDWAGLGLALLGSELFVKVRLAADNSISASNAYTDLGMALFGTHRWEGLISAIANIRAILSEQNADFTPEELSILNQSLTSNGFPAI